MYLKHAILGISLLLTILIPKQDNKNATEFITTNTFEPIIEETKEAKENNNTKLKHWNNPDAINILLIGQDAREEGKKARSDSMILVSLNTKDNSIKMISFMRDMYIKIPGRKDNRLNASYVYGGAELLSKTIEENFDLKIDGTIEVNFSEFKEIVDAIGGIELDIEENEIEVMNNYIKSISNDENNFIKQPGKQHLNGIQVLSYARIRYVGNGDFQRTERQRKILLEIAEKFSNMNVISMAITYKKISPYITTNIEEKKIFELGLYLLNKDIDTSQIQTYNIPENASYENKTIRGMQVLVPNIEKCKELLNCILEAE